MRAIPASLIFRLPAPARRRLAVAAVLLAALLGAALLGCLPGAGPAVAQLTPRDEQIYRDAFRAADTGRWGDARQLAMQATERLPAKILLWMDLARPDTDLGFGNVAAFIRENRDWPNLSALRLQAERLMPPDLAPADVRAWFAAFPPQSEVGLARAVEALLVDGERSQALALLRDRWTIGTFDASEEAALLARLGAYLEPRDHWARLDRLLWDGSEPAARRLLGLVDPGRRALAEARLGLAGGSVPTEAAAARLLAKVPPELLADPGLTYDLLRWRRRRNFDDAALQSLATRPPAPSRPAAWWTEINILARRLLDRGDAAGAYALVRDQGLREDARGDSASLVQAEFLAGWLALRRLGDPRQAAVHFARLADEADIPATRARAAYWSARAAEALGDGAAARRWDAKAAVEAVSFYGQLARDRAGMPLTLNALPAEPPVPADTARSFAAREPVRAVRMIDQIDRNLDRETLFLRRIGMDAATPADSVLTARLALALGRPDMAVATAKQAARDRGPILVEAGFPVLRLPAAVQPGPEPALVHALIRQESGFSRTALSGAGAMGLMQLMPATAQRAAGRLGLPASTSRLTADPDYNITLGSAYLGELLDRFNGSALLAVAAYNAGPSRVREWLDRYGDPRGGAVDPVDWIESIPFSETRSYVQRVLEGTQIYRLRLGTGQQRLADDLRR